MKRREWLKSAAVLGAAAALPIPAFAFEQGSAGPVRLETEIKRLKLRHTWTTTMSSSEFRDTLHVRYTREGITGYGEGAPIVRYKESAESARAAVESVRDLLTSADPWQIDKLERAVAQRVPGEFAGKAAIDIAVMDWITQKLGVPLYKYYGLDPNDAAITTFSIGIDKPEVVREKLREADAFPVLKIKVGLDSDEQMLEAVRSFTKKPLRVDANEGWTSKEEAVRKINWLESQGVQFVEQPMPAHMLEDIKYVRGKVHLPLIADESCLHVNDIPKLANYFDGVNIKLDKAGGVREAYRMIQMARALNMKVMIGCMVSSSCTVTAAAHLTPLVDYADLDGNLLIANDPYAGVTVKNGKLVLPEKPGLGLKVL